MEHVIFYSPNDGRFFALELVTNANDGFKGTSKNQAFLKPCVENRSVWANT